MATKKKTTKKKATSEKLRKDAIASADANLCAIAAADQENAAKRDERAASKDGQAASERAMARSKKTSKTPAKKAASKKTTTKKASTKKTAAKKAASKQPAAKQPAAKDKPKRMGVLDAAAAVLKDAKEPMTAIEMIEAIQKRGLWSTNGKTPHATLYAAIIREIQKKGREGRFQKTERGKFQLRKGA